MWITIDSSSLKFCLTMYLRPFLNVGKLVGKVLLLDIMNPSKLNDLPDIYDALLLFHIFADKYIL